MNAAGATRSLSQAAAEERRSRRVREEVKDGLAVIAFSAVASSVIAIVFVALAVVAG